MSRLNQKSASCPHLRSCKYLRFEYGGSYGITDLKTAARILIEVHSNGPSLTSQTVINVVDDDWSGYY